jgi:quinol-cytochrome oxidoreductase complex cytochrome b subunit
LWGRTLAGALIDKVEQNMIARNKVIKFFPYYFFEITLVTLFTVEVVLILAVLFPPAVGREIDFSAQYSPRPEWYFLFLYQLTKYFPGRWTFVGAVLLPGLAFSVLLLAPFLDNGPSVSLRQRKTAVLFGFGLLAAVVGLTIASLI